MSPLLPLIVAVMASAPGDHPKLEAGIELYRSGDLSGSLALLLEALDTGSAKQRSTARLYVGLIQHRTGNTRDAGASFKHALELWPQIRPPKGTPKKTIDAFEAIREKVAPAREPPPPRTKSKRERERKRSDVRGRGPETLQPLDSGTLERPRDIREEEATPATDVTVGVTEPLPETESEGMPLIGWIACGAGAAAAVAGITVAIVAGVNGDSALDGLEKMEARRKSEAAGTQLKAGIATIGAAGVLFGVAALTVTF